MTCQAKMMTQLGFKSQVIPVIRTVAPNQVRRFNGFHVSFVNSSRDYGCPTTALVLGGRVFLVLNGNHCAQLVQAAESADAKLGDTGQAVACLKYFCDNLSQANALSEHESAAGYQTDHFNLQETLQEVTGADGVSILLESIKAFKANNAVKVT